MIVKIFDEINNGWIWIDSVKKIDISENYCPHKFEWNEGLSMVLRIDGFEDNPVKNLSRIERVDYFLIDIAWMGELDENDPNKLPEFHSIYETKHVYDSKIITVTFMDNKIEKYAMLKENKVYILNSEGKTIEHL